MVMSTIHSVLFIVVAIFFLLFYLWLKGRACNFPFCNPFCLDLTQNSNINADRYQKDLHNVSNDFIQLLRNRRESQVPDIVAKMN